MFIHTGDQGAFFAAGFGECFATANADFFEGFEAIGYEGGADHEKFFDAALSELWEFVIGVGLQPRVPPKAGLEGDGILLFRNSGLLHEPSDRFEALSAIAGGVGRARSFAAVRSGEAMAASRVGFPKLAFGEAMEAEQQMIEVLIEVILRAGNERADVIRLSVERRLDLDAHFGRESGGDFFNSLDSGFEAGHCVVRKQWNQQEIINAFLGQTFDGVGNRRVLVAHSKLDREIEALLQFGLDVAAGDHKRGSG